MQCVKVKNVRKIASEYKCIHTIDLVFFLTLDKNRFLKTLHQLKNIAHDYPE